MWRAQGKTATSSRPNLPSSHGPKQPATRNVRVDIRPLRPYLYDPRRVGEVGRLLSLPYDLVSEEEARRLARRLPYHVAQMERAVREPGERDLRDVYRRVRQRFLAWVRQGVVKREPAAGYYLLEQHFRLRGRRLVRKGLFLRFPLLPFGERVFPHERTLAGPKRDRVRMLETAGLQFSPIFLLVKGELASYNRLLSLPKQKLLDLHDPTCDRTILYRLRAAGADVRRAFEGRTFLIADGHHRYESARQVFERTNDPRFSHLLAYVAHAEDEGIAQMPTHRLLPKETSKARLTALLPRFFRSSNGKGRLIYLDGQGERRLDPKGSGPFDDYLAVGDLLQALGVEEERVIYSTDGRRCRRLVRQGEAAGAFLMRPPPAGEVFDWAATRGRLPAKTTHFVPKLPSGLVVNRLF